MRPTVRARIEPDGRGTVVVDGQQLRGVRGVTVSSTAGEVPLLTVDLLVHELELDSGEMVVEVPERTAASLIALGWTPPAEG